MSKTSKIVLVLVLTTMATLVSVAYGLLIPRPRSPFRPSSPLDGRLRCAPLHRVILWPIVLSPLK